MQPKHELRRRKGFRGCQPRAGIHETRRNFTLAQSATRVSYHGSRIGIHETVLAATSDVPGRKALISSYNLNDLFSSDVLMPM